MNSQFNNNHFPPMQYPSQHPQFSRNVPNVWNYNSQQFHDNQDIDSDVMAESSDDTNSGSDDEIDDDGESDDTVEDEAKRLQDEETYIRFVKSVFCEEDDHFSVNSFTDEEDEEYRPDDAKEEDEDDDYVESRGGERDRVKNKELQGLVNECWQTIVGEAPVVPSGLGTEDNTMEDDNSQSQSTLPQERDTPSTHDSAHVSDQHNLQFHTRDASSPLKKRPLANSQTGASAVVTQAIADSNRAEESPSKASRLSGSAPHKPSVISSIVSQIFSGERPSEVCVEGMPVDAIRKLVARQMSMATQLLVQILLQADEKSECFTTAYTSLMELSNQREVAIKKAKLIQMNMRNVNVIHNYNRDQRIRRSAHSDRESHDETSVSSNPPANFEASQPHGTWTGTEDAASAGMGSDGESARNKRSGSAEVNKNINSPEVLERRLTRSGAGQQGGARRSASVFDIPALANVDGLFNLIDEARRSMKARKSSGSTADSAHNAESEAHAPLSSSSASRRAEELREEAKKRAQLLAQSSVHTERIMRQSGMRAWQCLVPLLNYPLSENMMMRIDPSSLSGRSLFTPAEDDLLLRGIITLGENNWAKVRSIFLPSKEAQLLQFRFSQMTSLTAPVESNNFRRYQKLEIEYRNRDVKWTHEEDVDLLRGFQTFGEKWPLIAIFYLPNRKRKEIKQRWLQLQKVWQKGFQIHQVYTAGCRTELTPNASSFLHIINGHGSHHVKAELFPGEGSMRSMGLVGAQQECDFEQDCLPDDDQQDWAEEEDDGGEGQSNSFSRPSASSTAAPSPFQQYGSSASGSTFALYAGNSNQPQHINTAQQNYPDHHQQQQLQQQHPQLGLGPGYSQQHLQQLMVMGGATLGAQRLVPSINTLKRAGIVPPKQSKQAQRQLQQNLFTPHTQLFDPSYLQHPVPLPSYPTLQYQPLSSHLSSHMNLPVPHNSGYHFAQSARDLSLSASAHPALMPSIAAQRDAAGGTLNNKLTATETEAPIGRHAGVALVESGGSAAADTVEEEFTAGMIPEHSLVFAPINVASTKKSTKVTVKQKRNAIEAGDKSGVAPEQCADKSAATQGDSSEPKKKRTYKPRAPKVGTLSSKKSKGGPKDVDNSGHYGGGAADMSSLLSLPFDENTMDSAWASGSHSGSSREGLMSLLNVDGSGGSHLNYDTMMAHAFQNDLHPHLHSDSSSPPSAKGDRTTYLPEKQHNAALLSGTSSYDVELQQCEDQFGGGFSNISQMDSLFGPLAALQSPSKPPAPSTGYHKNSPPQSPARATGQSGAPTDFAFSPPTTKLGNSSHIKRKHSVPRDGGDKRQKAPAGGLFASVMANINS